MDKEFIMIKKKTIKSKGIQKKGRSKMPLKSNSGGGGKKTPRGKFSKGHPNIFEIYVQYTHLENSMLLRILQGIEDIKEYSIVKYKEISGIEFSEVPRLNIRYVATGHSIILKYGGSLVPKIQLKDGDFIISVHKKIVFSAFVVYFLFKVYDSFLDTRIKQTDLEIKKIELQEKTDEQSKKKDEKKEAVLEFFNYVQNNPDIIELRINNRKIK